MDLDALLIEVEANLSDERLVGIALELARAQALIQTALGPLKDALRTLAASKSTAPIDTVVLPGTSAGGQRIGAISVAFYDSQVRLQKGADIARLQGALGDRFAVYFEAKTSYRPVRGFKQLTLQALTSPCSQAAEARVALASVTVTDATPRVSFKPRSLESS